MTKRLIFTLTLIFCVLNIGLGGYGLSETSEARYAEISREMLNSGDYLNPTELGIKHFHKPPLTYYITTLGYKIFGVNEFGARFFLVIALIIQLILIYKIGNRLFKNKEAAYASTLIYFSFPIVLISIRNLTTDAYLTTFFLLAIFCWIEYVSEHKKRYLYFCGTFLGLGFLTKGPVILLPFLSFMFVYNLLFERGFKINIHHVMASLLFLLISSSWFSLVIKANPGLWDYFLDKQIVNRAVNAKSFHREEPFWYYLAFAPALGLPWIALIFLKLINLKNRLKNYNELKLLVWSVLIILLLFSLFSSKLILYILPVYPFLALIGGFLFAEISKKWMLVFNRLLYGFIAFLLIGLLAVNYFELFTVPYFSSILLVGVIIISVILLSRSHTSENIKLLFPGFLLSFTLLISFSIFARNNPLVIRTIREPVTFISNTKPTLQKLFIYDKLIPSENFS